MMLRLKKKKKKKKGQYEAMVGLQIKYKWNHYAQAAHSPTG